MYSDLINEKVTVVVSSRGDYLLEYVGTLVSETGDTLELEDVDISYLMLSFQKGFFGDGISIYKQNIEKVFLNKRYVISCNK